MKPTFVIKVTPVDDAVPAEVRLRNALKSLLRAHGLKCVEVLVEPDTCKKSPR
jgi:hypothetical protein